MMGHISMLNLNVVSNLALILSTEHILCSLYIDESTIKDVNEYVPFLDIQFCIDIYGNLQTDLFVKPTDAQSYLDFSSAHQKHVFQGILTPKSPAEYTPDGVLSSVYSYVIL